LTRTIESLGRPGSWDGRRPSMAYYVKLTGPRTDRFRMSFMLPSMKRLAVSTRDSIPPPGFEICCVHCWPVTVGPISRGSVSLLFALVKDEPIEPVGAGGDSKGGGAIYAAALQQRPRQHSRSPTHRTCERPGPASSGRRRLVHMPTGAAAAAGQRGCRTR
jgi:hypothetical protein